MQAAGVNLPPISHHLTRSDGLRGGLPRAREGVASMINFKGQVNNICIGTGTSTAMIHYYKRPTLVNDIHGLGAVLLAGVEVLRLPSDVEE